MQPQRKKREWGQQQKQKGLAWGRMRATDSQIYQNIKEKHETDKCVRKLGRQ